MTSAYFESRILSADPIELIQILYEGALGAVDEARSNLARRNIAGRSAAIGKAVAILSELSSSLDHETGGEISRTLAELYDYMQRRLLEANFQQADQPLAEVARLLTTLSEGWQGVRNQTGEGRVGSSSRHEEEPVAPYLAGRYAPETGAGYGYQGWTL